MQLFKKFSLVFIVVSLLFTGACKDQDEQQETKNEETQTASTQVTKKEEPAKPKISLEESKNIYVQNCAACHGSDAKGLPNLGKDLTGEFIKNSSDKDLLNFIKVGRSPSDPANTTGIAMPPKGGNPALNDEKIEAIISYLRSLG